MSESNQSKQQSLEMEYFKLVKSTIELKNRLITIIMAIVVAIVGFLISIFIYQAIVRLAVLGHSYFIAINGDIAWILASLAVSLTIAALVSAHLWSNKKYINSVRRTVKDAKELYNLTKEKFSPM